MDYKIPLTQLLGSFRFIMLSPFLFECAHIHRPSQCSEAVLEQLSQITGSKIKQTWMCITQSHTAFRWICPYLQLPVSQQHNESNCEGGSVTDAPQQNHTESKSGLICVHSLTCSHFLTRQTFFVLIWHAVSFLVRRWNVSAAASQMLNCQLLLVGCKFRFQMIFHRKVKFLWFQCCLHASETRFNVQPSSSSSQSSDSVTCPLERHTVLHLCSRGAHGSTSPLKSVYYSFFASVIFLHLISILIFWFPRVVLIFTVQ